MKQPGNRDTRGHWWPMWWPVAVSLLAASAHAEHQLIPHAAEYKVQISVVGGRLSTELKATESGYVARHVIVPTGMSKIVAHGAISEVSEFAIGSGGVYPIAYHSDDTLSKDKTRADIEFDWNTNEASGTVNGQQILSVLGGLSHDHVSIQYQLMHDLLNDGPSAQYQMFEVDKLKTLNVRSVGTKEVRVPAGTFMAVGIQHQAENSSRVTTLWCVEEFGYLPVIIEQHRNGKLRVRATLRRYTPT